MHRKIEDDMLRLRAVVSRLEKGGTYTVDDILERYKAQLPNMTLTEYSELLFQRLCDNGQTRTAHAYRSAVRSLIKYNTGHDISFDAFSDRLLKDYETWMFRKGLQMNTVSFYMRNLRAIYYRAVKEKLALPLEENLFERVYTGIYETKRQALDRRQVESLGSVHQKLTEDIRAYSFPEAKRPSLKKHEKSVALKRALYYFLFCFYARGMSYIDLAYLRKQDLGTETFIYKRKKTGGYMEIKITGPMRKIIENFEPETRNSDYVFPIIRPEGGDERKQYERGLRLQNLHLKEIARIAGINKPISTHVSRHTWATLAKWSNVDISLISEALGHRDVKTTSIYLASFERSTLDRLSEKMARFIPMGL